MKRVFDLANLILLVLLGNTVYRAYPSLPARIPIHFNLAGQPDRWGGRGGLIALALVPVGLTALLYLVARFAIGRGAGARSVNIPHKEEFLRLPAEKQEIFWSVLRELLAGMAAAMNLLFYLIVGGTIRVAAGQASLVPFKLMAPALALLAAIMVVYFWRMMTLPGKLVRGEL